MWGSRLLLQLASGAILLLITSLTETACQNAEYWLQFTSPLLLPDHLPLSGSLFLLLPHLFKAHSDSLSKISITFFLPSCVAQVGP